MAFENGSVSFRLYTMPRKLPEDALERFAKEAAPPLETMSEGEVRGWVTGRHLLDRNIKEETAYYGGFLRLALRLAEKKVPQALLRAECRMEELAVMAAEDKPYLKSQQRAEIRKAVHERLLPNMPPQLKALPFICAPESRWLYATALSTKQSDIFCGAILATLGYPILPVTPECGAALRRKMDVRDWMGASFTPELEDDEMEAQAGREFLTWLWFMAEARGGLLAVPDVGEVGLLIEGPLTLAREGHGAHISQLRQGEPVNSVEAKTCLLSGKKLKQARLSFTLGEAVWRFVLDADEFVFRSMALPQSEENLDSISRFQERMRALDTFQEIFLGLYDHFLEIRGATGSWKKEKAEIQDWVKSRKGRM